MRGTEVSMGWGLDLELFGFQLSRFCSIQGVA